MSFHEALTSEHLDRAEAAARRPFDRGAIRRRARTLDIPFREPRADLPARELIAWLRRGVPLDPRLAALLREKLAELPCDAVSGELTDVAQWIGASQLERGHALRDVLRLYDAIARSRDPVRTATRERFPKFESRAPPVAS